VKRTKDLQKRIKKNRGIARRNEEKKERFKCSKGRNELKEENTTIHQGENRVKRNTKKRFNLFFLSSEEISVFVNCFIRKKRRIVVDTWIDPELKKIKVHS